jgi:hypothetical protein
VTWTPTAASRPDRLIFWAPTGVPAEAKTVTDLQGGVDSITTGTGNDLILAGDAGDTVNAGDGKNVVAGDNGKATFHASPAGQIATVETTDPDKGATDSITTGKDDDLVIGGTAGDTINAGAGDNVVLGDNGKVTLAADGTPQVVEATDPTFGGIDLLRSEAGNDLVVGGTGGDTIDTGAGNDLVFGDFGKVQGAITLRDLPLNTSSPAFTFASIATQNADAGSDDFIRAGAGHDIVIGGQGRGTAAILASRTLAQAKALPQATSSQRPPAARARANSWEPQRLRPAGSKRGISTAAPSAPTSTTALWQKPITWGSACQWGRASKPKLAGSSSPASPMPRGRCRANSRAHRSGSRA